MKKIPRRTPFQPDKKIKKRIPIIINIIGTISSNLYFIVNGFI
jgi:hypothetical protein